MHRRSSTQKKSYLDKLRRFKNVIEEDEQYSPHTPVRLESDPRGGGEAASNFTTPVAMPMQMGGRLIERQR